MNTLLIACRAANSNSILKFSSRKIYCELLNEQIQLLTYLPLIARSKFLQPVFRLFVYNVYTCLCDRKFGDRNSNGNFSRPASDRIKLRKRYIRQSILSVDLRQSENFPFGCCDRFDIPFNFSISCAAKLPIPFCLDFTDLANLVVGECHYQSDKR